MRIDLTPGLGPISLALLGLTGCATSHSSVDAPLSAARTAASVRWEVIGESADGRPVRATTIVGEGAVASSSSHVAVIAGIHGDEREGGRHLDELLAVLFTTDRVVRVYEDVNPDGTWRNARTTTRGVDPNRNWPASNFQASRQCGPHPLSEPGVAAVHADLAEFAPEQVVVLHSTHRGPFVNFDGPAESLATQFASAAGSPWVVVPSMGYPTPGSLGSWMGVDRQVPILTIEFDRDSSREQTGPALLAGISAVFGGDVPSHFVEESADGSRSGVAPASSDGSADEFRVR